MYIHDITKSQILKCSCRDNLTGPKGGRIRVAQLHSPSNGVLFNAHQKERMDFSAKGRGNAPSPLHVVRLHEDNKASY